MSSGIYKSYVKNSLEGSIDFINNRLTALLVDLSLYTPNQSTDNNIGDIPDGSILSSATIEGKFISNNVLQADPTVFNSVQITEYEGTGIVLYIDATTVEKSFLVCCLDSNVMTGFPVVPTGDNVSVVWTNGIIEVLTPWL
jgi:hypothetical protein